MQISDFCKWAGWKLIRLVSDDTAKGQRVD